MQALNSWNGILYITENSSDHLWTMYFFNIKGGFLENQREALMSGLNGVTLSDV